PRCCRSESNGAASTRISRSRPSCSLQPEAGAGRRGRLPTPAIIGFLPLADGADDVVQQSADGGAGAEHADARAVAREDAVARADDRAGENAVGDAAELDGRRD